MEQNRHSPLLMCDMCMCRVCWTFLCNDICVTDTCQLLLQIVSTLLHWAVLGGSMELIEWLMAHYALEVGVKTKVLLAHAHLLH